MDRKVDALIVGGGPAGMLMGTLLARAGRSVLVVERNQDFEREYRGEVLMPRALSTLDEVGLRSAIADRNHRVLKGLEFFRNERPIVRLDLERVHKNGPGAIWMPQPDFLEGLCSAARTHPGFEILFQAWPRELIRENGRTVGAVITHDHADQRILARVVIGADGRYSSVRHLGGFELAYEHHDFDVLWFTIPEGATPKDAFRAWISDTGSYLALPKHPAHIQCGMLVPPNGFSKLREEGIAALRARLERAPGPFRDFARTLVDFTPFHPLQAKMDLVQTWAKPGLLLVGDSAHTCSPAGAIGVAIALESAAVAADVLLAAWARNDDSPEALGRVQELREEEVRTVHRFQRRFAVPITSPSPSARRWMAAGIFVAGYTGLLRAMVGRVVARKRPLPLGPATRRAP